MTDAPSEFHRQLTATQVRIQQEEREQALYEQQIQRTTRVPMSPMTIEPSSEMRGLLLTLMTRNAVIWQAVHDPHATHVRLAPPPLFDPDAPHILSVSGGYTTDPLAVMDVPGHLVWIVELVMREYAEYPTTAYASGLCTSTTYLVNAAKANGLTAPVDTLDNARAPKRRQT